MILNLYLLLHRFYLFGHVDICTYIAEHVVALKFYLKLAVASRCLKLTDDVRHSAVYTYHISIIQRVFRYVARYIWQLDDCKRSFYTCMQLGVGSYYVFVMNDV